MVDRITLRERAALIALLVEAVNYFARRIRALKGRDVDDEGLELTYSAGYPAGVSIGGRRATLEVKMKLNPAEDR